MTFVPFEQRFFEYFSDLAQNNERTWFQENKSEYEEAVVAPMISLVQAMAERLPKISEHFIADPRRNGGSMFRIYRDTRFSKDKTPYKTHAAVQFRHALGKDVHAPGFYFHASPREVVMGYGIWHPAGDVLAKLRKAIDERPDAWIAARDHQPMLDVCRIEGERLKRPPKGYAKDHPLIEDLKRKDFVMVRDLTPPDLLRPDLADELARCYATGTPLMAFLCKAVGVPF